MKRTVDYRVLGAGDCWILGPASDAAQSEDLMSTVDCRVLCAGDCWRHEEGS